MRRKIALCLFVDEYEDSIASVDPWGAALRNRYGIGRRLKSLCVILLLIVLARSESPGQHLTPLYQYLVTNSPVVLAKELREFRTDLSNEIGKTSPGLKIDQLYAKMSSMRMNLSELLSHAAVSYERGTEKESDTIVIRMPGADAVSIAASSARGDLRKLYNDLLRKVFAGALNSLDRNESRNALQFMLKEVLKQYGGPRLEFNGTSGSVEMLGTVVGMLDSMLADYTIRALRDMDKRFILDPTRSLSTISGEDLATAMNLALDKIRELVDQAMDRAEHMVTSVADAFSNLLIAGNIGIAFTSGSGTLSGGVLASWQPPIAPWLQVGVFTNAVAGALDTTEPGFGLSGLQIRMTWGDFQAEGYYGRYYGNHHNFRDFQSAELGGGISFNVEHTVLLGAAFFYTDFANAPELATISGAISLGLASQDSPTLFLGGVRQKGGDIKPTIHLSYPIQPSL